MFYPLRRQSESKYMSCVSRVARRASGLNRRVIELGARAALALGLHINQTSIFARKNYFYPDLPKGYQISQYDQPFSANGQLEIMTAERDDAGHPVEWKPKKIAITRLHLEEDAGKNVHEGLPGGRSLFIHRLKSCGHPVGGNCY